MSQSVLSAEQASRERFDAGALIGAGALVGFGLTLWIAANWDAFGKFGRFGLIGAIVAVAGAVAIAGPRLRAPASLIGVMAVGGLLALFGQTYQSGADPWQLFALWAALTLPWALAARHDAVWCAWVVIAMTAVSLWAPENRAWPWEVRTQDLPVAWIMAVALTAAMADWPAAERLAGPRRWAFRLAAALALTLVTGGAVMAIFEKSPGVYWLGLFALAAAGAFFALPRRFDLPLLAANALALDVTLIAGFARLLMWSRETVVSMMMLALISAGVIAASAASLLALGRRAGVVAPASEAQNGRAAWPIVVLTGVGALIAAIPALGFLALALGPAIWSGAGLLVIGPLLTAGGGALTRVGRPLGFGQQFGAIGLVIGLVTTSIGLFTHLPEQLAALAMLAICAALAAALRRVWIELLLGAAAAAMMVAALAPFEAMRFFDRFGQWSASALGAAAIGAGALIALDLANKDERPILNAFLSGWSVGALALSICAAGQTFLLGATLKIGGTGVFDPDRVNIGFTPMRLAGALVALGACGWMLRRSPSLRGPTGYALAALATALAFVAPILAAPLAILAATAPAGRRALAFFAGFAALWIVGAFYYATDMRLIDKALLLIGLGLALAATVVIDGWRPRRAETETPPRPAWNWTAALMIAASLAATGAVVGSGVRDKEALLQNGRLIYMALAPVDPRSLTQGDYMALNFALPGGRRMVRPGEASPRAFATLDSRDVAAVTRIEPAPAEPKAGEVLLLMTRHRGEWRVGTNAFFFKEGEAKRFEAARFGMFRIDAAGRAVLVGLADKDLKPL